ncbi:MAG: hypothetical protein NTX01_02995 [Candidatus Omnitrophica bacterium]|nr:hypothetical protein [Candidatus Omnitrophota bacterium]
MPKLSIDTITSIIGKILLIISMIMVSVFAYYYLKNNTNFFTQAELLIGANGQLIDGKLILLLSSSIILFGLSMFLIDGFWRIFWNFLWDFLINSIALALFLIGVFSSYSKLNFKLALIVGAFIIYFTVEKAKEYFKEKKGRVT